MGECKEQDAGWAAIAAARLDVITGAFLIICLAASYMHLLGAVGCLVGSGYHTRDTHVITYISTAESLSDLVKGSREGISWLATHLHSSRPLVP